MKLQAVIAVTRDLILLGIGTFGILHQEITGHVNLDLLTLYGVLVGAPGVVALTQLSRGKPEPTDTTASSSEQVGPSASLPPS